MGSNYVCYSYEITQAEMTHFKGKQKTRGNVPIKGDLYTAEMKLESYPKCIESLFIKRRRLSSSFSIVQLNAKEYYLFFVNEICLLFEGFHNTIRCTSNVSDNFVL